MKATKISSIFMVLIMVLVSVTPAFAQAGEPPLCSGVMLQNTSTTASTTVNMDFYSNNDGTVKYSYVDPTTIPASGAHSYYIPSILQASTLPDGIYSVVVTSQQLLNSLVNEVTCNDATNNHVQASHSGINASGTGTVVYLAYLNSRYAAGNFSSAIAIQNAGTAATTTLKAEFFSANPTDVVKLKETFNYSGGLKPGETWYIDLSQGTYATANLNPFYGAVKITADQPVAAVANTGPASGDFLYSTTGVPESDAFSSKLLAPQVTKGYTAENFNTGISLFNANATDTPVRITYYATGSATETYHQDFTIAANSGWSKYVGGEINLPASFNGSAVIEVTGGTNKILGVINDASNNGKAAQWNLIRAEEASGTVYLPQLTRNFGTQQFNSGFKIFNMGGSPVDVQVVFTPRNAGGIAWTMPTFTIPANSPSTSYYLGTAAFQQLADNWMGGAVINVLTSGGLVVSQGNQVAAALSGDTKSVYNAFTP